MTAALLGHNGPPRDRNFKRQWASAVFACANKPVGAVAMAFRLFIDMNSEGKGIALTDLELAEACGVSDRSVRTFKSWLVNAGFIRILARGGRGGQTEYQACLPGSIQPEKSAGQSDIQPATISGNSRLNRKTFPEIEIELPEKISGQNDQPEKSSGYPSRVEYNNNLPNKLIDNNNIYNYNNNNNITTTAHADARTALEVGDQLLAACNGSLANPVNCQGLLSYAIPQGWIDAGCDIDDDILPTLKAVGKRAHDSKKIVKTWNFFSDAVMQARDQRVQGLKNLETPRAGKKSRESEVDKIHRLVSQAAERQRGGR